MLVDDDEVFEDPDFVSKGRELIGKDLGGKSMHAAGGYYLQADGDYHVKKALRP
jgi:hypothetical protein